MYGFTERLRETVGLTAVNEISAATTEQQQTLEHIKNILNILQQTPGFDPAKLAPQFVQLVFNPGVQRLGQQIASQLLQKALVRLIRELLASEEGKPVDLDQPARLSLPPARVIEKLP